MTDPMHSDPDFPVQNRQSTLVTLRWFAIGGQAVTILIAHLATRDVPLLPVLSLVGLAAIVNLWLGRPSQGQWRASQDHVAWQMGFDLVQLAALLALTGGLMNPFCLFLLAPVAVAAASLPVPTVTILAGLSILALMAIGHWHWPLPLGGDGFDVPAVYLAGIGVALSLGVASLAFFVWRMAEDSRTIGAAYASSRLALEREQRIAEVGALAAAVAHELNTPLATVSLIAHDLTDVLQDSPYVADLEMLNSQVERCRLTIARMTQSRHQNQAMEEELLPFSSLVEMAAAPHMAESAIEVLFDHDPASDSEHSPMPWLTRKPEILHGLGNFIQNGLQYARSRVEIETWWTADHCGVRITDDGPGFADHVLGNLGAPYVSGRVDCSGSHLGLGIFIAVTLLSRTGAMINFSNHWTGGAVVQIVWPRSGGPFQ